ncbi:MAG: YceD family protein [Bacilli bacterium]
MNINLTRLKSNIDKEIVIDEAFSFASDVLKQVDIIDLFDGHVLGNIFHDCLGDIIINVEVSGVMVLPCSITLEPVNYPFSFNIEGDLERIWQEINENDENLQNTIDILPIIWENVLMEIPMKVVSEHAHEVTLKGDGWQLINEENDN